MKSTERKRVAVVSRYSLFEQYRLAAEFKPMLFRLAEQAEVLHLSARSPESEEDIPEGVTVETLPVTIRRASALDVVMKSLLLYALLPVYAWKVRRFKPDAVMFTEGLPFFGSLLKLFSGATCSMHYGDRHLHYRWGHKAWCRPLLKAAEWIEAKELRYMDGLFTRTRTLAERMEELGVDPDRIRVVYDAPDRDAYAPRDMSALRRQLGFKADDVVLLYHGVMHKGKGLEPLLGWVGELIQEHPRVGLIMVGSGPELEGLRELAQRLDMGERVHFTGWLKTLKDVGDHCNAADICIAMRRGDDTNEAIIPGALLHAMACGKVVIAPDMRGMREIIRPGENGFVFKADDGESFKALIRDLMQRREEWAEVGAQACETIDRDHSLEQTAEAYASAILALTENGRSSPV